MLALAYLVKYHTVNVENRVRDPESTKRIMNREQGILNEEVKRKERNKNNAVGCNGNMIFFLSF